MIKTYCICIIKLDYISELTLKIENKMNCLLLVIYCNLSNRWDRLWSHRLKCRDPWRPRTALRTSACCSVDESAERSETLKNKLDLSVFLFIFCLTTTKIFCISRVKKYPFSNLFWSWRTYQLKEVLLCKILYLLIDLLMLKIQEMRGAWCFY